MAAAGRPLRGILTAVLTPFDSRGELWLDPIPDLLTFQRAASVQGVVVCGTNGEGTSLSVAERKRVLETVASNRGDLALIAGTGAASLTDALELTRHASDCGVDACLLLPPFFFKEPAEDGLVRYFLSLLDCADVPMLLYNLPQMTSVPITDALLDRLANHPRLAGVKDSAGDWSRTERLILRYPSLKVFCGSDFDALRCLRAGGAGCISGGANPFPELVTAVGHAFAHQTPASADTAQKRLNAMLEILTRYPFVGASKSILAGRGLPRMHVRPPLIDLDERQERRMLVELRETGLLPAQAG